MRLVFMGTPEHALPCLEALLEAGHEVVGVCCPPDRPAGRGRRPQEPAVKRLAAQRGLAVFQYPSLRAADAQEGLRALRPEALVVAAYGKLLPKEILGIPSLGSLNVHPSLLPRHRGPSPVVTAILEGDEVTGVTVMLLDEGMDTGPILAQREAPVREEDTTPSLTARLFRLGAALLVEVLPRWARGDLQPRRQDEARATNTRLVRKEDGQVDWRAPAVRIERRIRAYQPWPGTYTWWRGSLLKVLQAEALPGAVVGAEPGQVVDLEGHQREPIVVATGEGLLLLQRVQLEGKRPVDMEEFLRGHAGFTGSRLPS